MAKILSLVVLVATLTSLKATPLYQARGNSDGPESDQTYRVHCYYPNHAHWREGIGDYIIDYIDPSLCSNIHYGFAKITNLKIEGTERRNDIGQFRDLHELKTDNPGLRTLITVGGASQNPTEWEKVVLSQENMDIFVSNCIEFARWNCFDGIDLDWEYPEDGHRDKFSQLLKTFHERIIEESRDTTRDPLILAAALSPEPGSIYNLTQIGKYVDYANVMTYHLHGAWTGVTGVHSALYAGRYNLPDSLSQEQVVDIYENGGFPMRKFYLGVPTFGVSFTLKDKNQHGIGDVITGEGPPSNYTGDGPGIMAYYEVCLGVNAKDWSEVYDDSQQAQYAYSDFYWVGYDSPDSIQAKKEFVKRRQLAGMFFWDLSMDDFSNQCGMGDYPLLSQAQPETGITEQRTAPTAQCRFSLTSTTTPRTLPTRSTTPRTPKTPPTRSTTPRTTRPKTPPTRSTPPTTTTTTSRQPPTETRPQPTPSTRRPTTTAPVECEDDGQFIPHPKYCMLYYRCDHDVPHLQRCPTTLHFNPYENACDYPDPDVCDPSIGLPLCDHAGQLLAHPVYCQLYYSCDQERTPHLTECPDTLHFNPLEEICSVPDEAVCESKQPFYTDLF